jgi:hypothetical protein
MPIGSIINIYGDTKPSAIYGGADNMYQFIKTDFDISLTPSNSCLLTGTTFNTAGRGLNRFTRNGNLCTFSFSLLISAIATGN